MTDVEVRFLKEDKRKTPCAALYLVLADLSNNVNDRLHKALPGEIREARNIDHESAAVECGQ